MPTVRIIGPGRAGRSLAGALSASGWAVLPLLGRGDDVADATSGADVADATSGADVVVLAVPDDVIARVARAFRPDPSTPVVHLAGSLGPDVLAPHPRRAALHPLVALTDPVSGARRLRSGITFAVSGDPVAAAMAEAMGGIAVEVPDGARAAYHAAACAASNHVVALLGHVERIARAAGLPLEAFLPLARAAVEDAGRLGPRGALTGPAARGDWQTLARHLEAIPQAERSAYRAGVGLALQLTVGAEGPRVEGPGVEGPGVEGPRVEGPGVEGPGGPEAAGATDRGAERVPGQPAVPAVRTGPTGRPMRS